jgi:hypothetical protein
MYIYDPSLWLVLISETEISVWYEVRPKEVHNSLCLDQMFFGLGSYFTENTVRLHYEDPTQSIVNLMCALL